MIYLDANFFILCNFDRTARGDRARGIQRRILNGMDAITSSLSLDEVMWVVVKNKKSAVLRETVEDIYAMTNLTIKEVGSNIPLEALDIMEKYDLKPRDAFHTAIMRNFDVNKIVSDDEDFDRVNGIKRIRL